MIPSRVTVSEEMKIDTCQDIIKLGDLPEKRSKPRPKKSIKFMQDITLSEPGKDFDSFSHDDSNQAVTERNLNDSEQSGIFQIKKSRP